MRIINYFIQILFLQILFVKVSFATLTVTTTNANCSNNGSITLSSNNGTISSFNYSGISSGSIAGSTINLSAGIYSVTATLSSGNTETLNSIIVDHEDHIQIKNWYLTGNIPSTSVNWGGTLDNPLMTGWTGITINANGCVTEINLINKSINGTIPNFNLSKLTYLYLSNNQLIGTIPNFNLPNLRYLYLNNNQLSGCVPAQIKTNCPLIVSKSDISNNPNLSTQSWSNYWNNYIGACFEVTYTSTVANCGNNATITLKPSYNSIASFSYTGTTSGNGTGNTFSVPTGIYSITVTANNGQVDTLNDVIAENMDHFQLINWYLTANIPATSVNWGATLNDPFMTNWTGITKNTNGCITAINLSNKNITGAIPNFNLPYLTNLQLQDNQLSGCIPYEIKLNCPLITSSGGNISNNPSLSIPSWVDYWNNNSGACLNLSHNSTIANCGNNSTITLTLNYGTIASYSYSGYSYNGAMAGNGTGNIFNVPTGIYSVTVTANSGQTATLNNIIADNNDHIQLKNWYLTANIPSTSVNWGATLDNPLMQGWTGITTNANNCVTGITLYYKSISGTIPNFNLPNLGNLDLGNNQLSGTIPNFNLPNLTVLYLSNNQLSGTIPNFNLPNLTSLYLGYNQLSGTIPNFNLPNLTYLYLDYNQLSGTIPNFNLLNLTYLYLRSNQLDGTIPNFNLPNLTYLYLDYNQLSGTIPNFNLPNLTYLYLSNNQLSGTIPNFNLPKLRYLYLNDNQLSGCIPIQIKTNCLLIGRYGGDISNNPNLSTQSWVDYWNNYSGACFEVTYTSTVANCGNNATITLIPSYNNIASYYYTGTTSGNGTGNTFSVPTGIYSITVTANNGQVDTLNNVIAENTDHFQLKNWYLTGNIPSTSVNWGATLNDPFMTNWTGITKNVNGCITDINLSNKNITGAIPNFNLPYLTNLLLQDNQLSGCIPYEIKLNCPLITSSGGNISNNTNLSTQSWADYWNNNSGACLNLNYNSTIANCGNNSTITLALNYGTIASYSYSGYSYNGAMIGNGTGNIFNVPTGIYSVTVTANSGQTATLNNVIAENNDHIQLKNWYLTGNIPSTSVNWGATLDNPLMQGWTGISTNTNNCVTGINLYSKRISGPIPNFNLPNLGGLDLGKNQLSGSIPNFNLPNLTSLYLNNNQLSGNIPNFNLPNLYSLYLNNNQLSGTIPNFNLPNLKYLTLDYNQLSGAIPNFNLLNLTDLSLSSNQLSGTIPSFNLPNLTSLYLNSNQLSGNIPNFNLPNLYSLYLNNNQLSGSIPNFNLPNLGSLDLGNNQLSSTIPNFNLPKLYSLYLNNNQLSGCIPTQIKTKCPSIGQYRGDISNNPNLNTQSWADYWNNYSGACFEVTYTSTIANCGNSATIRLKPSYNSIAFCTFTGTISGNGPGNTFSVPTGIYSITVTANNGQVDTLNDVIAENTDHFQLKNWYLTGNIPSASVNWGATLNDPFMTNWTGVTKNTNGCITAINLSNKNITGAIPNFNLPYLTNLQLQDNQLSGCIPYEIKLNCPLITSSGGNISNNTNLSTQSWSDYWNNDSGACLNLSYNSTIANCGNNSTITITLNYGTIASYSYSGAMAGNGTGNSFSVPTGIYSVTVTANNGQSATLNNIIADNNDHIQLKNWYLTGNIPSTSVNWGSTLDNPLMTGWSGISTNANGCVTVIDLPSWSIIGTIPNFNLPNLTYLDLSYNQLSGTIPSFNLPNLKTLYFYSNQLSDTIPNLNLPNILNLSFAVNQLTGSIPNFNMTKLINLYLNNNQLNGTVPNFNLPNLTSLYLNNNQLSGCIPLQLKYNCPLIGQNSGYIFNNPNLNTQSWADYWNNSTGACPAVALDAKVFLQNTTNSLMPSYLSSLVTFPQTDPYAATPFNANFIHVNNSTVAQIAPIASTLTGNDTIVDWVFLELRQGISGTTSVTATKAALLQADGDLVGMNGTAPVIFDNATPGNYYISVRHRNHLGFRTANPIALGITPTSLNFTDNSIFLYGNQPTIALNQNQVAMQSGDANSDGSVDAFDTIDWEIQNGLFDDYTLNSDYNMDGSVDAFDSIIWELNNGKFQELD